MEPHSRDLGGAKRGKVNASALAFLDCPVDNDEAQNEIQKCCVQEP